MVDRAHRAVCFEVASHRQRVVAVPLHPQGQRLQAAEQQPAVEGGGHPAGGVLVEPQPLRELQRRNCLLATYRRELRKKLVQRVACLEVIKQVIHSNAGADEYQLAAHDLWIAVNNLFFHSGVHSTPEAAVGPSRGSRFEAVVSVPFLKVASPSQPLGGHERWGVAFLSRPAI